MLFWIHTHMYVRVHVDNLHTCMHVHTRVIHVTYKWHTCLPIWIIILKGPLSLCHTFWGDAVHYPKSVHAVLRDVRMASGMTRESSVKAALKGRRLFPCLAHVRIPLPALCVLPHFYVCFQKGEGQERAELVQKGGVSGRCEDFRIIKNM